MTSSRHGPQGALVLLTIAIAIAVGAWLRLTNLGTQIVIDDEWHALHKLLRADLRDIVTHLDYADYSIPLTLYFRAVYESFGLSEWWMRAPPVLAGITVVAAVPWLVRGLVTPTTTAFLTVLLAVSPILIYTSRTARPYAITTLLVTIAILSFHRWATRSGERQVTATGAAAVYVATTALAGWLHLTTLAFTLTPFLVFGWRALHHDHSAVRRLVLLAAATVVPLVLLLLPPLLNDWSEFSSKAGVDWVSLESVYRTLLLLAGSAQPLLLLAMLAFAIAGAASLLHSRRGFVTYLLAVMLIGTAAIIATRPQWVMHPPVLARYLVPLLPLALLLVAAGLANFLPLPQWAPLVAAGLGVLLAVVGPLPAQLVTPNQFMGHLRHQFDYDDARNPYVTQRPREPPPAFYAQLGRLPPESKTLIEMPWRLESHHNPHVWYQALHRQRVRIGMITPVCGTLGFGEYPESASGMRLTQFVHLAALLRGEVTDADYLIVHLRPWSTPPEQPAQWPEMAHCVALLDHRLGTPVFRDDRIVVFALKRPALPRDR